MSLRVFVEIGGLDLRQQHGDPAGVPVGAVWCSDAGCWLRELKDDEAVERADAYGQRCLFTRGINKKVRLQLVADLLVAAVGGEGQ